MTTIHILLIDDTPTELDLILSAIRERFLKEDIDIAIDTKKSANEVLYNNTIEMSRYDIVL